MDLQSSIKQGPSFFETINFSEIIAVRHQWVPNSVSARFAGHQKILDGSGQEIQEVWKVVLLFNALQEALCIPELLLYALLILLQLCQQALHMHAIMFKSCDRVHEIRACAHA